MNNSISIQKIDFPFNYIEIFNSGFGITRNSFDDIHMFEECIESHIVSYEAFLLKNTPLFLPLEIRHRRLRGGFAHQYLCGIAMIWLIQQGFSICGEKHYGNFIVDVCSADFGWFIECGDTESRKVLYYLERNNCSVGILPYHEEILLLIFRRDKNWSKWEKRKRQEKQELIQQLNKDFKCKPNHHKKILKHGTMRTIRRRKRT